jgi:hypothetical protein
MSNTQSIEELYAEYKAARDKLAKAIIGRKISYPFSHGEYPPMIMRGRGEIMAVNGSPSVLIHNDSYPYSVRLELDDLMRSLYEAKARP